MPATGDEIASEKKVAREINRGAAITFGGVYLARPIRAALAENPEGPEARAAFRALLAYSWPLGLRDAVLAMQSRIDVWVLALFLEPRFIGICGLAATVAASLRTIRASFDGIMSAVFAQMKRSVDSARIADAYLHAVKLIMAVQAPVLGFLVFFARPILSLSGGEYALGEAAVIVTAFTFALSGYLGLSSMVVLGLGKSRWPFSTTWAPWAGPCFSISSWCRAGASPAPPWPLPFPFCSLIPSGMARPSTC